MHKLILGAVSGAALAACGLGQINQHEHGAVVVLEGSKLDDELRGYQLCLRATESARIRIDRA